MGFQTLQLPSRELTASIWDRRGGRALTSAVGSLIRTIHAVLDPIAEAGHENTQLGAQAIMLVWLTSLSLALWACGQMEKLA